MSSGNPNQRVNVATSGGQHPPDNHVQFDAAHGRCGNTASTSQAFPPPDGSPLQQRYAPEWEQHREGLEEDRFGAGESAGMQAGVAPPEMGVMLVPLAGNQLTLAFKGEVYVFDCVSQEKVQAVLLLLGGRELTSVVAPVQSYSQNNNMYPNVPQRVASLMRFREKKKERNFNKKIHHNVRKEVERRLERYKDQFITAPKSIPENAALSVTSLDATQCWDVTEGCPQASTICHQCGVNVISTPMVHRGIEGPRNLCNACGLMWSNKGTIKDIQENAYIPPQTQDPTLEPNDLNPGNKRNEEQLLPVNTRNAQES